MGSKRTLQKKGMLFGGAGGSGGCEGGLDSRFELAVDVSGFFEKMKQEMNEEQTAFFMQLAAMKTNKKPIKAEEDNKISVLARLAQVVWAQLYRIVHFHQLCCPYIHIVRQ